MQPRINIITLGVKDISRSKKFYEDLGFKASSVSSDHFVAFKTNGIVLCLYPENLLAKDAKIGSFSQGIRATTLAYNTVNKEDVDAVLAHAEEAGAKIIKKAEDVFWGGYSGYFADPDGQLWEVAWNPHWPLLNDGTLQVPD